MPGPKDQMDTWEQENQDAILGNTIPSEPEEEEAVEEPEEEDE